MEAVSRPLLRLVQRITGMETSFVTAIDWDAQRQDVLFSLNTGAMQVPENSTTDWDDSMCRSMFLAGQAASQDIGGDVVATRNAIEAGMQSFVAVPILDGEHAIGTVCGASHRKILLRDDQSMRAVHRRCPAARRPARPSCTSRPHRRSRRRVLVTT